MAMKAARVRRRRNSNRRRLRIRHRPGKNEVMIQSNVVGWGAIPINGRRALAHLRDRLIEICCTEGIK